MPAVELSEAEFGAFFYNVIDDKGEVLHALYAVRRAARGVRQIPDAAQHRGVRSDLQRRGHRALAPTSTRDPRYGKNAPYYGMPKGHLPVRSYLAVPVVSRSGEVLGGLFFGHSQPGQFSTIASELHRRRHRGAGGDRHRQGATLSTPRSDEIAARAQGRRRRCRIKQMLETARDDAARASSRRARRGSSEDRAASVASRRGRNRLRDLHARSRRQRHQLEYRAPSASRAITRDEIVGQHFSRFYTEADRAAGMPARALADGRARAASSRPRAGACARMARSFWASVVINRSATRTAI